MTDGIGDKRGDIKYKFVRPMECMNCGVKYIDVPPKRGPHLFDCPECNPNTIEGDGTWVKA